MPLNRPYPPPPINAPRAPRVPAPPQWAVQQGVVPPPVPPGEPKEKPIFPIFFTLVTDGALPGRHNLLHVSAEFSPEIKWSRNILPQTGKVRTGARLTDDMIASLRVGAIPITQAMTELATWLERFHGARLPVSSSLAFWHLVYHMSAITEKMPFVSAPIDVNSFWAGSKGDLKVSKLVKGKDPERAMEQRKAIIKEACATAGSGGVFRWE